MQQLLLLVLPFELLSGTTTKIGQNDVVVLVPATVVFEQTHLHLHWQLLVVLVPATAVFEQPQPHLHLLVVVLVVVASVVVSEVVFAVAHLHLHPPEEVPLVVVVLVPAVVLV
ncbi:MAG TPA: hypothetical protein VN626_09885 [Clostridia bacterium]|nr:hypothetical protein [Clostridia bacterium]